IADSRISAHTRAHFFYINIERIAKFSDLVHEGDLRRQQRIRRVLRHFRFARTHHKDTVMTAYERRVEFAKERLRTLAVAAENNALRIHEVLHRRTFLQELRIADYVVIHFYTAFGELRGD